MHAALPNWNTILINLLLMCYQLTSLSGTLVSCLFPSSEVVGCDPEACEIIPSCVIVSTSLVFERVYIQATTKHEPSQQTTCFSKFLMNISLAL